MRRIAIDMDEVIVDILPKYLGLYHQQYGILLGKEDYWGKKIYQVPGAHDLRSHLHTMGFFADLPVMEGSQEVIRELMENFDVFIVTAAQEFRNSLPDKHDWLHRHFPFIPWQNFVFCGDKSIILADYMIDDHAFNLETFQGKGLLYTASHNIDETRYTRVNNWEEIRGFFRGELGKSA
ncbi:MAG: 5'(3')-deoxyribonucleotidase [Haliscomenobacter sp.]|nr:5'(3')-deoxyribonucleotidase [Haliscomenobacter sp.]